MRNVVWVGSVAILVIASGAVAGQRGNRLIPTGEIKAVITSPDRVLRRTRPSPAAVVNRVLSFDANGDDRIARDELPERMEGLVSRGDKNRDGFLTPDEIATLVDATPREPRERISTIVREAGTLADVIADLKLPPSTHNLALAIVKDPRNVHDPAGVDLQAEMKELLDDEDYLDFVAAVGRLRSTRRIIGGIVGGVAGNPGSPPPSGQPNADERR